jgi:hypothetical protein
MSASGDLVVLAEGNDVVALRKRRAGRPPVCPVEVLDRVIVMRGSGLSFDMVAEILNAEKIPTPGGKSRWWGSYVCRLLQTRHAERRSVSHGFRRTDGT